MDNDQFPPIEGNPGSGVGIVILVLTVVFVIIGIAFF
jgi:hypothetical protein